MLQVEELSASAADKKQAKSTSDPLDQYCDDNPEADECRWVDFSRFAMYRGLHVHTTQIIGSAGALRLNTCCLQSIRRLSAWQSLLVAWRQTQVHLDRSAEHVVVATQSPL